MKTLVFCSLVAVAAVAALAGPSTCESGVVSLSFRKSRTPLAEPVDIEARFRSIWYSNYSDLRTTEARGMFLLVR